MDHPILVVAMRYLHIVCAIVAVGGLAFIPFCLRSSLRLLEGGLSDSVMGLVYRRFHRVLAFCIAGLVVSGTYNWIRLNDAYNTLPAGQPLIGTKVLLALVMFVVVGARALGWIRNAKAALLINVHLAAIVILLGSILRTMRG